MNPKTYRLIASIAIFVSTTINYGLSNPTPGTTAGSRSYSGSSINWGSGSSSGGGSSWHK